MWIGRLWHQPWIVRGIWLILAAGFVVALAEARWSLAFVSAVTFLLSLVPALVPRRFGIELPVRFFGWIVIFVFATIFLGEAFDFYDRFWWWDVVLHGGSALAFGLFGFLFVFTLFEGDRYAAPAWALALISFSVALSIGAVWEIFEFAMDQIFGLNMQKTGLVDTMWDLIVDTIGAAIGAAAGFFYLRGRDLGGLTLALREFVAANRRLFRKNRR